MKVQCDNSNYVICIVKSHNTKKQTQYTTIMNFLCFTLLYPLCIVMMSVTDSQAAKAKHLDNVNDNSRRDDVTTKPTNGSSSTSRGTRRVRDSLHKRDLVEWPFYDENLHYVGVFLASYKYYEYDVRYESNFREAERPYHKHFPVPRLRVLHPDVERKCQRGVIDCVREIVSVAKESKNIHKLVHKKDPPDTMIDAYPLSDDLEMFRYRVTAAYFMCWFTMMREPELRFFMDGKNCLTGLETTLDAYYLEWKIVDWRTDSRDNEFKCAEIMFCPDPCYGKRSKGNVPSKAAMNADLGNPCNLLKDRTCRWFPEENENFGDLIRNRMNYTCNCESERKGFKWHPKYTMCIDTDECYEKSYKCKKGTICQNTVGAYICVCKRDERYDFKTDMCEEFIPLPEATFKGRLKHKRRNELTIWREIEIFLGLSSCSSCLHSVWVLHVVLNVIVSVAK